jgi:ABC-2 type transport system permease protein
MFSLQSATYQVKRDTIVLDNGPVALEIYHLPGFTRNLDWIMASMKASLTALSSRYGDYPFGVLRIVQTPGYGAEGFAAQALAGTIPFYEDGGWLQTNVGGDRPDGLSKTTAHEIAHMWWAHQIAPSNRPGALLLTESLAEMSSWVVSYDQFPTEAGSLIWGARSAYEFGRGKEEIGEPTLATMETQKYLAYNKGPVALFYLRDEMGREAFDDVLADFVATYRFSDTPYPNAQDLLTVLKDAASPEQLAMITTMFEDRVQWKSDISKLSMSGDARSGWLINVVASAAIQRLDPLGKVVKSSGIDQVGIQTMTSAQCVDEALQDMGFSGTKAQRNDCFSWSPHDMFKVDLGPEPTAHTFVSKKTETPFGVQLGADIVTTDNVASPTRLREVQFFKPANFPPPKPNQ